MNLNELAKEIHKQNHRWWTDAEGLPIVRIRGELLMLAITELAEAVEGTRKDINDDHLPQFKMEVVEMADCKIRLLDYSSGFNIRLEEREFEQLRFFEAKNKRHQILMICEMICRAVRDDGWIRESIFAIDEYCRMHGLDLETAFQAKLLYNQSRRDHTHEARAEKHGKAF